MIKKYSTLDDFLEAKDIFSYQLRNDMINPVFVSTYDFDYMFEKNKEKKRIGFLFDDSNTIKSAMIYEEYFVRDDKNSKNFLSSVINLRNRSIDKIIMPANKNAIYLKKLESFEKRKGYGTKLLNFLKDDESVSSIFLDSLKDSRSFYEANRFQILVKGLMIERTYYWTKD